MRKHVKEASRACKGLCGSATHEGPLLERAIVRCTGRRGSPVSAILNQTAYSWSLSMLRGTPCEPKGFAAAIWAPRLRGDRHSALEFSEPHKGSRLPLL
jgi:hypothetical protein